MRSLRDSAVAAGVILMASVQAEAIIYSDAFEAHYPVRGEQVDLTDYAICDELMI